MIFRITQYTNLSLEQDIWIDDLATELDSFFANRTYGNDLDVLYFGLITVKPEYDEFFKKKRPRYKKGSNTLFVDGVETQLNSFAEIECKIDFMIVSKLNKAELIERVCQELLTESNCLTRLSKLKNFDFDAFRLDLENFMIEKRYLKR